MTRPRLRALVLAAGRGERLRPLTDRVPKPLLPVAGEPIAGASLRALAAAGCEGAALNLHHLGEQIRTHFGDAYEGMPLHYSREPVLLGTLGALAPLRGFLGEADVLVLLNGDSLCEWPLAALIARHQKSGAVATLLLHETLDPAPFGGGVGVDGAGYVTAFRRGAAAPGEVGRRVFAGAHVLSPALLARIPDGPGDIIAGLYEPLLAAGARIATMTTRRRWHDLGTPRRYLEGVLDASRRPLRRPVVAPGAVIDPGARVEHTVLETGAVVERGAQVLSSVLLPGCAVGAGARLERVVLGHGAHVPPGETLRDVLVTRPENPAAPLVRTSLGA
jgi:mannose-1-phosphate guanylyltransferase